MPLAAVIDAVCDDGSDFDDNNMGYASAHWDYASGVLTLRFERDEDSEAYIGNDWASAEYRFRFIEDSP
jgi:hypothetical protein